MNIMDKFCLKGRKAIVTGGAQGIGFNYASAVAAAGADVAIADINGEKAREAAENLHEMGLDTDKIAQAVGYAVETVKGWLGIES